MQAVNSNQRYTSAPKCVYLLLFSPYLNAAVKVGLALEPVFSVAQGFHKPEGLLSVHSLKVACGLAPELAGAGVISGGNHVDPTISGVPKKGGTCTVTYNPDDVTTVWLFEKQKYTEFSLIERCFKGESISDVENIKAKQKALIFVEKTAVLQAKIDLNNDISVIAETARNQRNAAICGIRNNRKREQIKTHIDYAKAGERNG